MATVDATTDRDEVLVTYMDDVYDIREFMKKHPGGTNTLAGLDDHSDMTKRFALAPPHSEAAMYLMREYRVKRKAGQQEKAPSCNPSANEPNEQSQWNGHNHISGRGDGLMFDKSDYLLNDKSADDDRLEHLVDWNKAMIPQVWKMGDQYGEWVNKAVDRQLRLFGPWYLECLTKTPWWTVPLVWAPTIAYLIVSECLSNPNIRDSPIRSVFSHLCGGILLWTALEYMLHRWVFHMDSARFGAAGKTFHFLLHGLHHKVPFDPNRLVFPPVPALILATLFYQSLNSLFANPRLVLAGGLTGYLIYDMIHYYLHYGSPTFKHVYHMKRYHYQHHFVHHDKGFGISSPLWDYVFHTEILLRKLKYTLKW